MTSPGVCVRTRRPFEDQWGVHRWAAAAVVGLLLVSGNAQAVDCAIDADPVAMLMVTWGRMHQADAIVKRQLVASGPKDYLGPRFRGLLRNP